MKLTEHRKNGQFFGWRKEVLGRRFHLGSDRVRAEKIAKALVAMGETLEASGGQWTDAVVEECYAVVAPVVAAPPPAPIPAPTITAMASPVPMAAPVPPSMSTHASMDAWLESEKQRLLKRQISPPTYRFTYNHIARLKKDIGDMPLSSITTPGMISEFICLYTQRPGGMSADYAYNMVRTLRTWLDWCDKRELWIGPRRWLDEFARISVKSLQSPAEKKKTAKGFRKLSVEECQHAWAMCFSKQAKVFLGLGLWCGQTAAEIATALLDDFVEEGGELYLDRLRHKTGIPGRWWVPPEVAKPVREWLASTRKIPVDQNPDRLAFLTRGRKPLLHYGGEGMQERSDAVADVWESVRRHCRSEVTNLPSYKYLRKTLAQAVRDVGGEEMATLFCAQSFLSVQSQHYTKPDPSKLEKITRETIYLQWRAMFDKPAPKAKAA
jgi:hypothetical protein